MSRVAGKSGPYHHGDLRAALVAQGLEIARSEGPSALSLREVTRRAGVSPAAAYRHFRDRAALMGALGREIQELMAHRMRARSDAPAGGAVASADGTQHGPAETAERAQAALRRLRGVGLGYIEFAVDEPGWFELAFFGEAARPDDASPSDGPVATAGPAGQARLEEVPPFAELLAALEDCVTSGALSAGRRAGAEFSCWSAVHGCAELMVHGPLRGADPQVVRAVAERVVDDIISGIRG